VAFHRLYTQLNQYCVSTNVELPGENLAGMCNRNFFGLLPKIYCFWRSSCSTALRFRILLLNSGSMTLSGSQFGLSPNKLCFHNAVTKLFPHPTLSRTSVAIFSGEGAKELAFSIRFPRVVTLPSITAMTSTARFSAFISERSDSLKMLIAALEEA
jgi:hypothetical protein